MNNYIKYVDKEQRNPEVLDVESLEPIEQESIYALFAMSVINYDTLPVSFKSFEEDKVCFFKNENGWSISYGNGGVNTDVFYATDVLNAVLLLLQYNVCNQRISEFFDIRSKGITEEEIARLNQFLHTDDMEFRHNFANDVFEKCKGYSRKIK